MEFKLYPNTAEFLAENEALLNEHEAEVNLIIMNAQSDKSTEDGFFGAKLTDGDAIFLCIQCKPFPMVTFCLGEDVEPLANRLADHFQSVGEYPKEVNGTERAVECFVAAAAASGVDYKAHLLLNLRELTNLKNVETVDGIFVNAKDVSFDFTEWARRFLIDCNLIDDMAHMGERAKAMQESGNLYCLLVGSDVVTMAAMGRQAPNGRGVAWVYTPDALRGKGYSIACMKHLTKRMLQDGNAYCFLYADKANPVSNHIYEKLGYDKTGDFAHYILKES